MVITNTYFEVPLRRRYTWKTPGDIGRYQIDYILEKLKYRNQIRSSYAYPGYNIDSDHNLVMAKCNVKFKKRFNGAKIKKWCLQKLQDKDTRESFQQELSKNKNEANDWEEIKQQIKNTAEKVLGKNKLTPKKPWMTPEILDLIN